MTLNVVLGDQFLPLRDHLWFERGSCPLSLGTEEECETLSPDADRVCDGVVDSSRTAGMVANEYPSCPGLC